MGRRVNGSIRYERKTGLLSEALSQVKSHLVRATVRRRPTCTRCFLIRWKEEIYEW